MEEKYIYDWLRAWHFKNGRYKDLQELYGSDGYRVHLIELASSIMDMLKEKVIINEVI